MKRKKLWIIIAIAMVIGSCLYSCSPASNDDPVIPPVKIERPIVKTVSVIGVYDSVTVVGKIIDNGNAEISSCGVIISSYGESNKTIPVSKLNDSVFTVKIPIKFGITYGFSAYGKNSAGIGYGTTLYYSYSASAPIISATSVTEITENSGVALDTVDNGNLPTKVTILFGRTSSYTDSVVISTIKQMTSFKFLLRNLEPGSEYHFRFKAENKLDTVYTSDRLFCTGIKDYDGNYYPVTKIGDQLWIAKDLATTHYNDGTPITNLTDNKDWFAARNGAYCYYNNDPEIGKIYGALYNWYAISTGKLAPKGWHCPSYDEFMKMVVAYGLENHLTTEGYLKEAGYDHWKSPNTGATNATGFTALPAGHRSLSRNNVFGFWDLNLSAVWWTADEWTSGYTRILYMDYDETGVYNNLVAENWSGMSVRLVKNSK